MKKLIFTVVTCLMLSLASCGSSADYEAIHKKLEQHEKPTTADYSAMATYVEECVDEMKSMKGTKKDTPEGFAEFEKKYPYWLEFMGALVMAEDTGGELDDATKEKLEKIQSKGKELSM